MKNGKQYVVFDYKDSAGKRKRKWVNTELPEKCTKKALKEAVDQIVAEFDEQFRTGTIGKTKAKSAVDVPYAVMTESDPEAKMKLSAYIDEWLTAVRPNLARTTFNSYKNSNKRFVEYLDEHYPDLTLGTLRYTHVQEFLNHKLDEGRKGSCAKQYYLAIHSALAYAVKMEYIPIHPMDKLVVPRADRYEATFYNKDELNTLFETFKNDKLELIVHIAAYYGLRRSEVLGLRWDAIDFTNKTITIETHDIEQCEKPITVYNFKVEDYHTYFVGNCKIWVHNNDCVKKVESGEIELETKKQKGNYGEMKMDEHYDSKGFEKMHNGVESLDDKIHHGIDGVYKNKDPNGDPKFIIAEAKYGSSQLGNTKKSGPQMGDKWIKNNIGKIVDDPDDIIEGLATGDTVKELFRVNVSNDNGLVNVTTSVKSLK